MKKLSLTPLQIDEEEVAAAIKKEYDSWGTSRDTWTGQRAVRSVAESFAQVLHPGNEARQNAFLDACGVLGDHLQDGPVTTNGHATGLALEKC